MPGPGDRLGPYLIRAPLARGGQGRLFVAEEVSSGRSFALKLLRPELAGRPDAVARFVAEARAANRIGHPHIVEVHDFGTSPEGIPYFVMELLAGESLAARLTHDRCWPLPRALNVAIQIAEALGTSHQAGIVHRDLKPENVFLVEDGDHPDHVKVLDFGLAKLMRPQDQLERLTRPGAVFGTPHYMSPEQCLAGAVDQRTDIYSLAVVLYEMLTGRVPFEADSATGVVFAHVHSPFPRVRRARPDLDGRIDVILQRAGRKIRDERWPVMSAFADALRALEAELVEGVVPRTRSSYGVMLAEVNVEETVERCLPPHLDEASADATLRDPEDSGQ